MYLSCLHIILYNANDKYIHNENFYILFYLICQSNII